MIVLKKMALFIGIVVVVLGGYFISIYSFSLNEKIVGSIEVRKNGAERIELSKEEVSYLVNELNDLNSRFLMKTLRRQQMSQGIKVLKKSFVSLYLIKMEMN